MPAECVARKVAGILAGMESVVDLRRLLSNVLRFGTVAEVDLARARCRVQSGELLTDFVPWLVPRAGETIEWSAPSVGEQVILLSPGGDTHGSAVRCAGRGTWEPIPHTKPDSNKHHRTFADHNRLTCPHPYTNVNPFRSPAWPLSGRERMCFL